MKIGIIGFVNFENSAEVIARELIRVLPSTEVVVVPLDASMADPDELKRLAKAEDVGLVINCGETELSMSEFKKELEDGIAAIDTFAPLKESVVKSLEVMSNLPEPKKFYKIDKNADVDPAKYFGGRVQKGRKRGKNRRK